MVDRILAVGIALALLMGTLETGGWPALLRVVAITSLGAILIALTGRRILDFVEDMSVWLLERWHTKK